QGCFCRWALIRAHRPGWTAKVGRVALPQSDVRELPLRDDRAVPPFLKASRNKCGSLGEGPRLCVSDQRNCGAYRSGPEINNAIAIDTATHARKLMAMLRSAGTSPMLIFPALRESDRGPAGREKIEA